jgi:nucleoside-diphosphate-sugar epimerase
VRVAFIGGTRFVGPAAVRQLLSAGHEVAICHTGAHETPTVGRVEHLHGSRDELLAPDGPVERWRPEALVDTFAGGASALKGRALAQCALRAEAGHVVAISSMDVYRYCVDAGMGDGSGVTELPREPLPLGEDAMLRDGPYPGAGPTDDGALHDNVAMEQVLRERNGVPRVTALRPGAIYGAGADSRERVLVEAIREGETRLPLPDGGVQLFHRVAVERIARAVAAALERAPEGFWACNVADPVDWTYAGLAGEVARLLGWEFEPERVGFDEAEHPWQTVHPILCSDRRLREVLGVTEPDPREALAECVAWLWDNEPQRR